MYIGLAIVLAVVGIYYLYVRHQTDYFVRRNLRLLAGVTRQLNGAFEAHDDFVRNWAHADPNDPDRDRLLPLFDKAPCALRAIPGSPGDRYQQLETMPGREVIARQLVETSGVGWLQLAWDGYVRPQPTKTYCLDDPPLRAEEVPGEPACRQIRFDRVLEPILNRDIFGAFDAVFIADQNGRVLYSITPPHTSSSLLWPKPPDEHPLQTGGVVSSDLLLSNLGAATERLGWRERTELSPKKLRDAGRRTDIRISDTDYVLFTQPYLFRQPCETPGGPADGEAWLVAGVVSTPRFRSDVRSVSASKVALSIALCVIALCGWPFLRIVLMTNREALRIADVILVVVCSIIGIVMLTLTVLDTLAYQRMSESADEQLRQFAYKLDRDFRRNVNEAWAALDASATWGAAHAWTAPSEGNLIVRAQSPHSDVVDLYRDPAIAAHPYFSSFAFIDREGQQRYKASTGTPQALVNVADRRYFREAVENETWDGSPSILEGKRDEQHPYALEWVHSRTSGQTEAVLAKPNTNAATRKQFPVVALTTDLIDVAHAIPPPGVDFAIIDEQGNVIFHSDEQRIGSEDFFLETDLDRALRAAVLGRTDALVTTKYWGEDQRMFVHPLQNSPWTLVSFRGKRLVRAVNIEALLLAILFLSWNGLPYLVAATILFTIRPWYRAPYLWPSENRNDTYVRVITVVLLGITTMGLATYALQPLDLVPVIALVPAQVYLSIYVLLHRHRYRKMSNLAFGAWILISILLAGFLWLASIDAGLFVSPTAPRVRILLELTLLFQAVVALVRMSREDSRWHDRVTPANESMRKRLEKWPRGSRVVAIAGASFAAILPAYDIMAPTSRNRVIAAVAVQALIGVLWATERRFDRDEPQEREETRNWSILSALWWLATIIAVAVAFTTWPALGESWVSASVVTLTVALCSLVTLHLADTLRLDPNAKITPPGYAWLRDRLRPSYPNSYKLALGLILVLAAVMPAIGYFKISVRTQQEGLIKFAQLRLATALEDRINAIAGLISVESDGNVLTAPRKRPMRDALEYRLSNVWDTTWTIRPDPLGRAARANREASALPGDIVDRIPEYSEDSVAMRQLYTEGSADDLWWWLPKERLLTLERLVRLDARALQTFWPERGLHRQTLSVTSAVPLLFPAWISSANLRRMTVSSIVIPKSSAGDISSGDVGYTAMVFCIVGLFAAVLWLIARFITERILVIDVEAPNWARMNAAAPLGSHVFLMGDAAQIREKLPPDPQRFIDVELEKVGEDGWEPLLRRIDAGAGKHVRILDFEHAATSAALQKTVLDWLERLLARPNRTILLVSGVSPAYVLALPAPAPPRPEPADEMRLVFAPPKAAVTLRERWQKVFATFLCLNWDDVLQRAQVEDRVRSGEVLRPQKPGEKESRRARDNRCWCDEETEWSSVLRELKANLNFETEREKLIDELGERAEPYYSTLWADSSLDERLLLYHLARYGFAHNKNRRILRRLIARGLVRRDPNLELMSETFRLYVLGAAERQDLAAVARDIDASSLWSELRVPIFIVILSMLLLLFATQKDLLTLTAGLTTAITTGLPVLAKLFGMFAERRMGALPRIT